MLVNEKTVEKEDSQPRNLEARGLGAKSELGQCWMQKPSEIATLTAEHDHAPLQLISEDMHSM